MNFDVAVSRDDEEEPRSFKKALKRLALYGLEDKLSSTRHSTLRRASVLVLLSKDGKVLLNQRSQQLKSHPGQVCFPGGKQDPSDKGDDIFTALRETEEEVGLKLKHEDPKLQFLCRMPTVESINHLCVTPIVVFLDQASAEIQAQLRLNESEVQKAFWVPLEFFVKAEPVKEYEVPWAGEVFVYREYVYQETESEVKFPEITGLTAHMVHTVAKVAFGGDDTRRPSRSSTEFCGHLYRYFNEDTGKPYWSRRYFILGDGALLQYDSERQATRKSQSASKKNRLRLGSALVGIMQNEDSEVESSRFAFKIEALEGRVVWKLAAPSDKAREEWVKFLSQVQPNLLSTGD